MSYLTKNPKSALYSPRQVVRCGWISGQPNSNDAKKRDLRRMHLAYSEVFDVYPAHKSNRLSPLYLMSIA